MSKSFKTWQELEDYALSLIQNDRPKKPPNSGGSKKEEDIVGQSCLIQCKNTGGTSITIKEEDVKRLRDAASALNKFPIFVSSSASTTLVSFISDDYTEDAVKQLVQIALVAQSTKILKQALRFITSPKDINLVRKEASRLKRLFSEEVNKINKELTSIEKSCDIKYDDLTMIDLFEGTQHGIK